MTSVSVCLHCTWLSHATNALLELQSAYVVLRKWECPFLFSAEVGNLSFNNVHQNNFATISNISSCKQETSGVFHANAKQLVNSPPTFLSTIWYSEQREMYGYCNVFETSALCYSWSLSVKETHSPLSQSIQTHLMACHNTIHVSRVPRLSKC